MTPVIWEIDMDTEDLLTFSVKGEDLKVDTSEDDIYDSSDNRSREFDPWSE